MLRIAAAQCAPVFLNRQATTQRVLEWIDRAADAGVELLAFGETFLPGYPFWLSRTDGARFEHPLQRELYSAYLEQAVDGAGPELAAIAKTAAARGVLVVLGLVERAPSGGSVYCSCAVIDPLRGLRVMHRKLVPTYEERLIWAPGDGNGLRCVDYRGLRVATLNCWENWMPQARHALYADGCSLLVAVWPGSSALTQDITRFAAREGRLYVLAAGAILRPADVGIGPSDGTSSITLPPAAHAMIEALGEGCYYDGGSAIAGPDGEFLVAPVRGEETLVVADIDPGVVRAHRQSFDPAGHYSRPDVFEVHVDRQRRSSARFRDQ